MKANLRIKDVLFIALIGSILVVSVIYIYQFLTVMLFVLRGR